MRTAVRIAETNDHFTREGEPWFLLADTVWFAFTHMPIDEWDVYLRRRRQQGFNTLIISILPVVNDMTILNDPPTPFANLWNGAPEFGRLDVAYVRRIRTMLEMATRRGFVPLLGVLPAAYAPRTWASDRDGRFVMPDAALRPYIESLVEAVGEFSPIYAASGDTDFEAPETAAFYVRVAEELRRLTPDSIITFHSGSSAMLPDAIADLAGPGFYAYQSGHVRDMQANAHVYAEWYSDRPVRRPVVNLEPCYEGSRQAFTELRFDARDVRRATWASLLGGASAGVGYGAQGVWGWHRTGAPFMSVEFSGEPFDRFDALQLDGAWDVALAKHIVESDGLHRIRARQDLLAGKGGARIGATPDGSVLVIYVADAHAVELNLELESPPKSVEKWNLVHRRVGSIDIEARDGKLIVPLGEAPDDALVIIRLR